MARLPLALVLQPSNGGLALARSLGRRGVPVHTVATEGDAHTSRSRLAQGEVLPTFAEAPERWLACLQSHGGSEPVIVLAGADEASVFLSQNRDELPENLRFFERLDSVHLPLMDKTASTRIAIEAGVKVPWTCTVENADDLEKAIADAPYPCVLKPVLTHLWRPIFGHDRVLRAYSGEELRAHGEKALGAGLATIVSEYVPGGDDHVEEAILTRAPDGTFPMQFGCQKLRQSPAGFGAASLCVSAPMPESLRLARALLSHAEFVGVAGVETKRHAVTGEYYFIEANVRLPTQFGLGDAAGAEASWRTYATLAGLPLGPAPTPEYGVRLLFPELEIAELRRFARGDRNDSSPESLGQFLRGYRNIQEWGVLDLRDPGPMFSLAGDILGRRMGRFKK